jgi:hypothetical protein
MTDTAALATSSPAVSGLDPEVMPTYAHGVHDRKAHGDPGRQNADRQKMSTPAGGASPFAPCESQ